MALKEVPVGEWATYDPVVPDRRMEMVEGRMRSEFLDLIPDDMDFVSFIQPPKEVEREDGLVVPTPSMAIFAVVSDNPKHPSFRVMTNATTHYSTWLDAQQEFEHFTGRGDPLINIFRLLVRQHLQTIQNLRELD